MDDLKKKQKFGKAVDLISDAKIDKTSPSFDFTSGRQSVNTLSLYTLEHGISLIPIESRFLSVFLDQFQ